MITADEIIKIGVFNKPHGIKGEISATLTQPIDDIGEFSTIICSMEGIFVPFFIEETRSKGSDTILIKIQDVDSEFEAKKFTNQPLYVLKKEYDYEEGIDCNDLVGYEILDGESNVIGKITDIIHANENMLFAVERNGNEVYIPIAEDFIVSIDDDNKKITMELPDGILDL